jgi:hypothetical protein
MTHQGVKLVFCCRRRAELTTEEFQTYWLNSHAELVQSVRAAMQRLLADELTFVDMPRSSIFIAEEHVIF